MRSVHVLTSFFLAAVATTTVTHARASVTRATPPPSPPTVVTSAPEGSDELRICSDPANLPFSNDRREGFENRIADVVARDLHKRVVYTWFAQRRGFIRSTLKTGACDVIIGVPHDLEMVRTTKPYYRSTYAFVTRKDRKLDIKSLDDVRLRTLKVGVPLVGDDYENPPPVAALARRGIVDNLLGFPIAFDRRRGLPALVDALDGGEVDVAIVWGPMAGDYAHRSPLPLKITPVAEAEDHGLPMTFAISMGVRKGDAELAKTLDDVLVRRKRDIDRILDQAGVVRP